MQENIQEDHKMSHQIGFWIDWLKDNVYPGLEMTLFLDSPLSTQGSRIKGHQ